MGKFDRFCQSCGMPKQMDTKSGGTEKDGSISKKYCSYCYENGSFHDDFTDVSQMVKFVKEKLKESGYGVIRRWFYSSHIKQLERWKK